MTRPWFNAADAVLITILFFASIGGWVFGRHEPRHAPWQCRIRVLGTPSAEILLTSVPDRPSQILGRIGTSTLEWDAAGNVRFASSPCPNQICVHTGWTTRPSNVVCVPNGILVEFPGRSSDQLDGISR